MTERPTRTLLLVEDSEDDRAYIRRLLRDARGTYSILEASTGEEALELVRTRHPDLVLLDYYLPDTTGVEFLADLRAGSTRASLVPVAVLTGHDDEDAAVQLLAGGAMDYLVKGTLTGPGLARAIENAIGKFTVQVELEEKRASLELRNWELEALRDELQQRLVELSEAHRAKDQFLAVMSHEMRTPLNAILGYVDLLGMGVAGELTELQRAYIERVHVGGRHLLDLINDVLDLARADARRLEMDLRPV
ncbi:MAG: response regulator, partial [Gemmatimonadetes bacterium]|nr:response regulator [Gemmatimonadota bacterium]